MSVAPALAREKPRSLRSWQIRTSNADGLKASTLAEPAVMEANRRTIAFWKDDWCHESALLART
jgi:hypothetical protein